MTYNPEKPYKDQILGLIKKTWKTRYVSVYEGTYAVFKRKFAYHEVDHTDGIGTKGVYHWEARTLKNAVLDALAMNLNDLAMARATPYKLQCHLILPKDDGKAILDIMKNLVAECKKRDIAITGGETSIQNNIRGLDISLTVSGFVKEKRKNQFRAGDVLVGLASSGLHSNGFTTVRKIFGTKRYQEFMESTKIYSDVISRLDEKYDIHGMMHITGGAYTKLKGIMRNVDVIILNSHELKPQPIFKKIYSKGVSDIDMYKIFNCGIGFVMSVPGNQAIEITSKVKDAYIIGEVASGTNKVRINSMFSDRRIIF